MLILYSGLKKNPAIKNKKIDKFMYAMTTGIFNTLLLNVNRAKC